MNSFHCQPIFAYVFKNSVSYEDIIHILLSHMKFQKSREQRENLQKCNTIAQRNIWGDICSFACFLNHAFSGKIVQINHVCLSLKIRGNKKETSKKNQLTCLSSLFTV